MDNPFYTVHLDATVLPQIREICVDRQDELALCKTALIDRRHNVLLYGTRGVGKTFLLRLLEDEIRKGEETVYPCFVNIASLPAYGGEDEVASFPRAVLLQFCTSLWRELLGRSYLELRDRLDETGKELHFRKKAEVTVQRVYTQLMVMEVSVHAAVFDTVGFSAGVKGEKRQEVSRQSRHSPILPFEFAEFAQELVANVLMAHGKKRVVFLCDEANQMPIFRQEQILERYLELFSSKEIQFLFVAGLVPWDKKSYLPSCFETRLELKGFPDKRHVRELIEASLARAEGAALPFSTEAVDAVCEAYGGHPRYTLEACALAYWHAQEGNADEVTASAVLKACREIDAQRKRLEDQMREDMSVAEC